MTKVFLLAVLLFNVSLSNSFAQGQATTPVYVAGDPITNISVEMTKVSANVTALTRTLKSFVDKFEKVGGITFNEKQQKLILGMELLQRAESRLAVLQKSQIELVEKLNETRAKLAQNEIDARPRNIDRSLAMEGTTELQELRDNKREKLQTERSNLTMLSQQIQSNLADTTDALRDAQSLVNRLRRLYLPQIERELYEQLN
ncbi:MAG: hypothetical protein WBD16_02630 [Pyrinomonadaceae bacterium]